MQILGVIPARLASTRLPRKMLRDIGGRPLIVWVYEAARRSPLLTEIVVAADSDEVFEACKAHDVPVVMTSPDHICGSDRLFEVMQGRPADVYVNIQGDEPLLRPEHLANLLDPFAIRGDEIQVTTLKVAIGQEAAMDPNNVKVVTDARDRALYFSRWPLPYDRDKRGVTRYKHIGLYAYRQAALEQFHALPPSDLQLAESLEQLKFLHNGIPVHVFETAVDTVGVDTEADLDRVRAILTPAVPEAGGEQASAGDKGK